jgi:hypothetical protein
MPINGFQMKDIGPIRFVRCENLPSIVIISGANGVGKSTLLESLKKRQVTSIDGTGKFLYTGPYRAPAQIPIHKSLPFVGPRTRYIDMLFGDSFSFNAPGISVPYYLSQGGARSRSAPDFGPYFQVKCKLAQFEIEFEHAVTQVLRKLGEIPRGHMPVDIFRPFRELVERLLPGIRFDGIVLDGEIYKIWFLNRMGIKVEFDQLSSGEKDIIAMLFPFIEKAIENEFAKARSEEIPHEDLVMMIDTPEAYLHPTLQRNLLDYVRNSIDEAKTRGEKLQFFFATHSTVIINEARPEELYVLRYPDESPDENQFSKIVTDEEKLSLIREVLGDTGIASIATGKPIIVLEGKDDIEILKLLRPDIEHSLTLLPLGGKGKIVKFDEMLGNVMSELDSRGFKMFAILDRDSSANVPSNVIFTWSKACIENFLLVDSEAIHEAAKVTVGEVKLQSMGIHSKEEITHLVNRIIGEPDIAEEEIRSRMKHQLRFYVGDDWKSLEELEKIVSEIFDKKVSRIRELHKKLSNEINDIVKVRERALAELDGKIIMGRIAREFGLKREILARTVADRLRSLNRVPSDVTDLITQIENSVKKAPEKLN